MKSTGQMLKERRESLKLSLSEISMSTKINQKVLKAIEEGNPANLPAKTFLRGFVQAYAIALKLDVDQVMKAFFEEMGTTTPEVAEIEDSSAQVISGRTLPKSMQSSTTIKILAVSGIVVLILLVIGVKNLVEKYENESRVEPVPESLESLPNTAEETIPAGSATVAAGETLAEAPAVENTEDLAATSPAVSIAPAAPDTAAASAPVATVAPAVVAPPPAAVTTEALKVETPKPVEKPVVAPTPPPPVVAAPVAQPTPPPAAVTPPPAAPTTPVAASKEVILEALDRIEVAVKVDKGALKKIVLQPDEVYTIKGTGKIVLDLSDGGAVNLIVNGQDRGVPGDLGKPKKVELP